MEQRYKSVTIFEFQEKFKTDDDGKRYLSETKKAKFSLLKAFYIVSCVLTLVCFFGCHSGHHTTVVRLRCQDKVNPEGVEQALLSWQIASAAQDVRQTAWEVEIFSSERNLKKGDADVWKSGKQISDRQLDVVPSGAVLTAGELYWWRVRIWDEADEASEWSAPASFSLGPQDAAYWQAKWITAEWTDGCPMPYFRKVFDISAASGAKPVRAVVYLSGLGCGDLFLNGKQVDETRIIDPAQTDYEKYAFYNTFNVTALLKSKENCIGVMLGDGWYNQGLVWGPAFAYGKPMLFLQMEITYDDGSKKIIGTDESWKWFAGPVLKSNLYAGETYDAGKVVDGWADAAVDCSHWQDAVPATGVIPAALKPQIIEPVRLQREITPVALWQNPDGKWVFDFGVNVAAVPRITVSQPKGTHLRMCMGEYLNDDRTVNYGTTGVFATGVIQTDEYICAGNGTETWTPRFTYHGFRYLELSGMSGVPDPSWIKAVTVYTDVPAIGRFECSEPQINRLHEMAVRTMLSNIHGIPTDCPHRERCGWLGDAHTVAPFENCNYDMNNFWMKYLDDIKSSADVFLENTLHQKLYNSEFYFADKAPGIPFMIAPGRRLCGVASPDWGTAVVQLPWFTYLYYGNARALEVHYPEMKQWVDHIAALADGHIVPYGLGDWCPPGGNQTIDCPIPLSSTAFHYYDASIVAQVAAILDKKDDAAYYRHLKEQIGKALTDKFYDSTNKTFGSQTADAMALDFGFAPVADRKAVSDAIVRNIEEKYNHFFHTGIFGMGRIGQALSRNGNSEAAWKTFTKKGENSFEWMWTNADATTLWEILPIHEESKAVCLKGNSSLNHPMLGGYDTWFYEDIAGIRPEVSCPGYKIIRFEPTLTGQLEWAKASISTPYGKTESDWSKKNGKLMWKITVPPNASGWVALPVRKKIKVNEEETADQYPVVENREDVLIRRFPSGFFNISIEE
ncbi:MAG: glycoside hydrolase family 78 protein [Bacteroidales bacterium]|jgi:alpha-L-rhamnosidase|nr:glycoside hydrolase family 78 protein [Bacteroidales bacterium]